MLFASSSFGEGVFMTILFVGAGIWAIRKVLGDWDKDGKLNEAVKGRVKDWLVGKSKK